MYRREIVYDRLTKDYCARYDGQVIGFYGSYLAAEVALDHYVSDLLADTASALPVASGDILEDRVVVKIAA